MGLPGYSTSSAQSDRFRGAEAHPYLRLMPGLFCSASSIARPSAWRCASYGSGDSSGMPGRVGGLGRLRRARLQVLSERFAGLLTPGVVSRGVDRYAQRRADHLLLGVFRHLLLLRVDDHHVQAPSRSRHATASSHASPAARHAGQRGSKPAPQCRDHELTRFSGCGSSGQSAG